MEVSSWYRMGWIQVHNGRAMRNPEMVPGRAMFPSRCEKRRGADEVGIGIGTGRFGGAKKRHECPQGQEKNAATTGIGVVARTTATTATTAESEASGKRRRTDLRWRGLDDLTDTAIGHAWIIGRNDRSSWRRRARSVRMAAEHGSLAKN